MQLIIDVLFVDDDFPDKHPADSHLLCFFIKHTYPSHTVEVIKLDVEGWEHPVFAGARDLLENHPPRLLIFETACGRDGTISDTRLPVMLTQYGFCITRVERPSGVIKPTENYVARQN